MKTFIQIFAQCEANGANLVWDKECQCWIYPLFNDYYEYQNLGLFESFTIKSR